jgi:hypothetical protein
VTEVNINITLRLSEGLEEKIERLLDLLTTATHQYEEGEDYEDQDKDDAAS